MSSLARLTLWSDTSRSHFFLIPDQHPLPPGNFVLRTLTGREQCVDEAALAPYEVSEEQAKNWLESEFGKMLDNARGAVNRFVEKLRGGPGKPDRIVDLRELLDRIETILDLMATEDASGGVAANDIRALAERFESIAEHFRQLSDPPPAAPG
ncbi:MAG TPA: hypothetical protein VIE47_10820 [Methylocystis sp.]|jgi:predicted transcriptional regulator